MPAEQHPTGMRNLKSRKLYLRAYDEIKDYISQNQLRPGDKLPTELEMCELLGVSRNVLREAIKALEITGVVDSKPGVGIVIREFNTEYLFSSLLYGLSGGGDDMRRQMQDVRKVLEVGYAREAFDAITSEALQEMRCQLRRMQNVADEQSGKRATTFGPRFAEADAIFHRCLYQNANNEILLSIIDAFWACDKYYLVQSPRRFIDLTVTKHTRILETLENRDYDQFYEAMLYHFNVEYKPGQTSGQG